MCYITACSHIFCYNCGSQRFRHDYTCPGCEKLLAPSLIKEVHTNPSEETKLLALCGLPIDIVLEMIQNTIMFWTYQKETECAYLSHEAKNSQAKYMQLESVCEEKLAQAHRHIQALQSQIHEYEARYSQVCTEMKHLQEQYSDKCRQKYKLEEMYTSVKTHRSPLPPAYSPRLCRNPSPSPSGIQRLLFASPPRRLL